MKIRGPIPGPVAVFSLPAVTCSSNPSTPTAAAPPREAVANPEDKSVAPSQVRLTPLPTPPSGGSPEGQNPSSTIVSVPSCDFGTEGIPGQLGISTLGLSQAEPQIFNLAAHEPGRLYRFSDAGMRWSSAPGACKVCWPPASAWPRPVPMDHIRER